MAFLNQKFWLHLKFWIAFEFVQTDDRAFRKSKSSFSRMWCGDHLQNAMKNETLTISGVLFKYIFDSSQGQWCLTRKQSSNWSTSFQSIFNSRSHGPGINKSECLDYCGQYSFSSRPSRSDFPFIRLGLRVYSLIFDFANSIYRLYLGMNSETDQEIFWYPKYWVKIDINCFPFMPMFHLILKQWILD